MKSAVAKLLMGGVVRFALGLHLEYWAQPPPVAKPMIPTDICYRIRQFLKTTTPQKIYNSQEYFNIIIHLVHQGSFLELRNKNA